jgi:multiple sugar transport system substrate-binding protein
MIVGKKSLIVFVLVLAAAIPLVAGGQEEQEGTLEGTTLNLLVHPTIYAAAGGDEALAEFMEATGIEIRVTKAAIPEYVEKSVLDFTTHRGGFDVIAVATEHIMQLKSGLLPLDKYIARDADEWGWDDFIPAIAEFYYIDGQQLAIPQRYNQRMFYYRKDLFEANAITPPETLNELWNVARKLTTDTVYGIAFRGKPPVEIANDWLQWFISYGGDFVDKNGRSTLNTQAGKEAAVAVRDLYKEGVLPADIFVWGRDDVITAMQTGRLAMTVTTGTYYTRFFGADSILKKDQIGWDVSPTAPGVSEGRSLATGWFWAINKDSNGVEAAWELIKFYTSKENQIRASVEWGNGPVRQSAFENPAYHDIWPQAPEMLQASKTGVRLPLHMSYTDTQEIVSNEVTALMRGDKSVEQALADMDKQINIFIDSLK